VKRRTFITLFGGAATACPLAARGQQPILPVIGFLDSRSSDGMTSRLAAFRQSIVFLVGEDPTRLGLVTSLARPSGNLTGVNMLANELEAKRLHLLHQLVPQAQRTAVLVNPDRVIYTETTLRDVEAAARTIGLQLQVLKAKSAREIEEGFAWSERQRPDALFVGAYSLLEHPACGGILFSRWLLQCIQRMDDNTLCRRGL
jgi:ABC-type uncharacterized transport system substrate-binding protein